MLNFLGLGGFSVVQILLAFYANFLPFALYAVWLGVALWDITHRDALSTGARVGWSLLVIAIPLLGPIAYYVFGHPNLSRNFRWTLLLAAPAIYLVLTVMIFVASGFFA
jgi:hypothetical protein